MEVNDLHVGRKLFVTAGIENPAGIGGAPSPSIPPLSLTTLSAAAWVENALVVGNAIAGKAMGESTVVIGRAPITNVKAKTASIFKVTSLGSEFILGTPVDIMLGDVAGPCGVQMYGGPQNPFLIQAKDLLFTAITAETHAAAQKAQVTASANNADASKTQTGTQADNGAEAHTGSNTDQSVKINNGPTVKGGTTDIGSAEVSTTSATLNTADATAKSAQSLAGKGFDIPHPTKKEHRLRYICLEGPEVGAYFRGTLKDSDTIELPEYWRELVYPETITVNLTPIGSFQELFVEKIEWGTKIKIKNNSSSAIHCHYTVFAERVTQDKLQVEYKGLTPDDYPGDNSEYALGGWDYARHKGEPKPLDL